MKINAIYFSCGRDQDMLNRSIESLRRNWNFNKIFVASDNSDPVTERLPDVEYIEKEASSEKLYGLDNIASMHDIFIDVAHGLDLDDYVMKIDSDVLCCSDIVFKRLEENLWDCYGAFPMAREDMIPPGHFNGNAYFLKARVARQLFIARYNGWPKEVEQWSWMNYPEDMVTSTLCNKLTKNIQIDWTAQSRGGYYLFDIFLTAVAAQPKEEIRKYGFAHCRTTPNVHEYLYKKIYEDN